MHAIFGDSIYGIIFDIKYRYQNIFDVALYFENVFKNNIVKTKNSFIIP